jgi:hypothetical protein
VFEWKHGDTASIITFIGTNTPRSNEFVSATNGPIVYVYGMLSDEPFIKMSQAPLQQLDAIVAEIKRERKRLLQAKEDAERKIKTTIVSITDILNHPTKSMKAEDYMEEQDV